MLKGDLWKLEAKGNSGLKYLNFYLTRRGDAAGHEFQMADDDGDPGAKRNPFERSGALYEQVPPSKSVVRRVGEFNQSRILVRGRHAEHWLNGEKVVEYELSSSSIRQPDRVAAPRAERVVPQYPDPPAGLSPG